MQIIFYTRDFSSRLDSSTFKWSVQSYEWSIFGGPLLAEVSAPVNADAWDAATLLRCPVEIVDDNGESVWWGYVNEVKIPGKLVTVGVSLDNMYNKVRATYADLPSGNNSASAQLNTTYAEAQESIAVFGTKEYTHQMGDGNADTAEATRDRILEENKYPIPTVDPFLSTMISLKLRGWWNTLEWQHYVNSGTTDVATTQQIVDIVADSAQFLEGAHVFNASGVNSNEFRDGQITAKAMIEDLLEVGTSDGKRLIALVNRERFLEIHKLDTVEDPDYRMRDDGSLENIADVPISESNLKDIIGKWVTLKSAPSVIGNFAVIRPFLVESAVWRNGKTTYRPLGQSDFLKVNFSGAI